MAKRFWLGPALLLLIGLAACAQAAPSQPAITPSETRVAAATATVSPSVTPLPPSTQTAIPSVTASALPSPTPTPTPVPTYVVLRGIVNQEHVSCFYGPSKAYLYKYGLLKGNRLDILGYIADTGYIEVQAIGGDNPCWMNLEWMDVQGDINTVQPIDPLTIKRPWSPFHDGLSWVTAERKGNEVTITWPALVLRAGDDSEQEPYLLETWVCRDGKLTFVPIGVYQTTTTVVDEPGCNQPSFGRVYGVEKHGYTKYLKIPWPQAE